MGHKVPRESGVRVERGRGRGEGVVKEMGGRMKREGEGRERESCGVHLSSWVTLVCEAQGQ